MVLRISVFDCVAVRDILLVTKKEIGTLRHIGFCPALMTPYSLGVSTVYANAPNARLRLDTETPTPVGVF